MSHKKDARLIWVNKCSILQAIETGVKLQSVYDTLEKAVKHTTNVHQWPVWKNEINVVCTRGVQYVMKTHS